MDYSERLKVLGLPTLEYRRERADMVEVYKILYDIDKVDKSRLFTLSSYTSTRGRSLKLFKRRSRLRDHICLSATFCSALIFMVQCIFKMRMT